MVYDLRELWPQKKQEPADYGRERYPSLWQNDPCKSRNLQSEISPADQSLRPCAAYKQQRPKEKGPSGWQRPLLLCTVAARLFFLWPLNFHTWSWRETQAVYDCREISHLAGGMQDHLANLRWFRKFYILNTNLRATKHLHRKDYLHQRYNIFTNKSQCD